MLCNSWIIEDERTGTIALETYNPRIVSMQLKTGFKLWTAHDWLCELNNRIQKGIIGK